MNNESDNETDEDVEDVSFGNRGNELAEAANSFSPERYNEFRGTLKPEESLYCDLLRIKAKGQEGALLLSDSKKAKLAERYSETLSLLWKHAGENDNDIEKLSKALLEINRILPDGKKIRPQFSNERFKADGGAPGNFSFCDIDNMKFISVNFAAWQDYKLQGTTFSNCDFGKETNFEADNFKLVYGCDDCTFKEPLAEIDDFDKGDEESITEANNRIINRELESGKEIRELKQENKALKQENEALRAQLLQILPQIGLQPSSSSASGFFDSSEKRQMQEDLSDTQATKTYKRGA